MHLSRASLAIWLLAVTAGGGTLAPSSRIHIWVFEIPSVQEKISRWNQGGVPMEKLVWGDTSYQFPEKGMVFHSRALQAEAKGAADFLRAKYPETLLGENLAIECILDERNISLGPDGERGLIRQLAFGKEKTLSLRIELKKMTSPLEAELRIRLLITLKSKNREVIDCVCSWDMSKQLYVGFPSYLGEGRKGNVYFVTLLYEART